VRAEPRSRRGSSLIETTIAMAVLLTILGALLRGALATAGGIDVTAAHIRVQVDAAVDRVVGELEFADLAAPAPDATAIACALPIDPDGDGSVLDAAGAVQWGANVGGVPTPGVQVVVRWTFDRVLSEAALALDVNGDGDTLDSFDLGRLERVEADGGVARLTGNWVAQPTGARGGDIDGDGVADPLFSIDASGASRRAIVDATMLFQAGPRAWLFRRSRRSVLCLNDVP